MTVYGKLAKEIKNTIHYSNFGARRTACGRKVKGIVDSHFKKYVTCRQCITTKAFKS